MPGGRIERAAILRVAPQIGCRNQLRAQLCEQQRFNLCFAKMTSDFEINELRDRLVTLLPQ